MNKAGVDIAIVGMAATFAKARDLAGYWQNILNKVDAVTEAPDTWAAPYFDPTAQSNDRIYTRKGGFLHDLAEFDPTEFGIMPNAVDGGEPDQYLALKLARDALRDAGYLERRFDRERTGIILGRGTYVNRGYSNLMQHGMMVDQTVELVMQLRPDLTEEQLASLRQGLKDALPPFNPEMCPGLVPNVVSGRIANRLDLMGPNFIVDAACASSLIAVELAIDELRAGRCDMMLAGGVHVSTPPQIYMIFCQIDALSHSDIRPFDVDADGTLLGEGVGLLVLKRLADAERDGDRIYALIKGVGTASDGKALGLLAPRLEGEVLAVQRAYQSTGIAPETVGLVEAHGTSIRLGDQTEIRALSTVFGMRDQRLPRCAVGSVKSMISHCIPAAGAAGLIKTALALHHKILPPTLCERVNPALGIEDTALYINNEARPWIHGGVFPRRAGVNAFGFGGINAHAVLEEYRGNQAGAVTLHTQRDAELLVFAAPGRGALMEQASRWLAYLQAHPKCALADVAYTLAENPGQGTERLALVARDAADAARKLAQACDKLTQSARIQARNGVYAESAKQAEKVVFLFPGEGAQYPNMLADLCLHFPQVRSWFDFLDQTYAGERTNPPSALIFPPPTSLTETERRNAEAELYHMDLASECVFTACMALHELVGLFGVRADATLGHSTGENAALIAAGMVRFVDRADLGEKMRLLNRIYQDLERSGRIPTGVMLSVGAAKPEAIERCLAEAGGRVHLAIDNCANQAVLFGARADIQTVHRTLAAEGAVCMELPFDRAYHTPLFAEVGRAFAGFYAALDVGPGHAAVYSCAAAAPFAGQPAAIRRLAEAQWSTRVRFRETIERLYADGMRTFVELGPSSNLSAFVEDILRGREALIVAANNRRRGGLEQLLHLLARLYVHGHTLDFSALYRRSVQNLDRAATTPHVARPRSVLNLHMPRLRLTPERLAQLAPREPSGEVRTAEPGQGARVLPFRREASVATAAPAPVQDDRTALLQGHFGLMREFLANQARVLSMIGVGTHPALPPVAAMPAAKPNATERQRYPLLGTVQKHTEDELIAERRYTLDEDHFLCDHTLGGRPSQHDHDLLALPVIPFTFSMEILAEAALALAGGQGVVTGMRAVRGYRWLTLDQGDLRLLIHARYTERRDTIAVRVFQRNANTKGADLLVFEGEVQLAAAYLAPPSPMPFDLGASLPSRLGDEELYATGMFHGPLLQGVKHVTRWSPRGIEAELEVLPTGEFFRTNTHPEFLTDAGLLDAAGQLVGYWLSEQIGSNFNCFPFQLNQFDQYSGQLPVGHRVLCRGLIEQVGEMQILAQIDLLDESGCVIARLSDWRDRHFPIPRSFYECRLKPQTAFLSQVCELDEARARVRRVGALPEGFLDLSWGIWRRVLAHLMLSAPERHHWNGFDAGDARANDWLLGRIAAKDTLRAWLAERCNVAVAPADIEICNTPAGRPYAVCRAFPSIALPALSIAHKHGVALAAVAENTGSVGIDLEILANVDTESLSAGAFTPQERAYLGARSAQEWLALWCAKEAAAKACGTGLEAAPQRWTVIECGPDCTHIVVRHDMRDYPVAAAFTEHEVLAWCIVANNDETPLGHSEGHGARHSVHGNY